MATVEEILMREDFYDAAILRHGFVDYMRDYEVIVGGRNGPPNTDIHKYQFVGCVEASYRNAIADPALLARSLPDEFVYAGPDYPDKEDPDGFVWGVRYSNAHPGLKYIDGGERAAYWSRLLNRTMHEVTIETEVFHLRLVFADIRYAFLGNEPEVVLLRDWPIRAEGRTSDGGVC